MNKLVADQKYTEAIENSDYDYEKYFLAKFFDLKFEYTDETCKVEFEVEDFMYNPHLILHGGVIAFALDVSMGHLCKKIVGAAVTAEMKVQYFKAVKTGRLSCEAKFLKKGRRISFLESRMTDSEGNLIAMATGTFAMV